MSTSSSHRSSSCVVLTRLSDGDQVMPGEHGGDGVGLNWSWNVVPTQPDVLTHNRVESSVVKLCIVSKIKNDVQFLARLTYASHRVGTLPTFGNNLDVLQALREDRVSSRSINTLVWREGLTC